MKYCSKKLFVSIVFEVYYKPYTPKGFVALDTNLRQVMAFNGYEIKRYKTRFIEALSRKKRAEELQRKFMEGLGILLLICLGRIMLKARRHGYAVAIEDLSGLREHVNIKSNDAVIWKLSMFACRRLPASIMNKAIEYNVPVVLVNPMGTSTTCPRCGARLNYT